MLLIRWIGLFKFVWLKVMVVSSIWLDFWVNSLCRLEVDMVWVI